MPNYPHLSVLLGILDAGMWYSAFGNSLRAMELAFRAHAVPGWKTQSLRTQVVTGSILPKSRLEVLKEAKRMDATYLVFIDSDQTFPSNTLHKLIFSRKDVIGANIATKKIPSSPTARHAPISPSLVPIPVFTDAESTGLEEVWRVGTGILCLHRSVFLKLPHDCFEMRYRSDLDDYVGEDWALCEAIEKLGAKIWIDHDLSQKVGHVGLFTYTHEVVGELVQVPETERQLEMELKC